jgi:hypothetical protein
MRSPNGEVRSSNEEPGSHIVRFVRKRMVIGSLATVMIGVVVLMISQPKEGTVERHKREYLAAIDRIIAKDVGNRFTGFAARRTGMPLLLDTTGAELQPDIAALETHKKVLCDSGVLAERTFLLTNLPPAQMALMAAGGARRIVDPKRMRFVVFKADPNWATNQLTVVCARGDIVKFEELIRKADVP